MFLLSQTICPIMPIPSIYQPRGKKKFNWWENIFILIIYQTFQVGCRCWWFLLSPHLCCRPLYIYVKETSPDCRSWDLYRSLCFYIFPLNTEQDKSRPGEGHVLCWAKLIICNLNYNFIARKFGWNLKHRTNNAWQKSSKVAGRGDQRTWKTNNFWKRKQWKFLVRPQWWQNQQCCSH